MEHVATALKKTPEEVRKANLYQNGQVRCQILLWRFTLYISIPERRRRCELPHNGAVLYLSAIFLSPVLSNCSKCYC